MYKNILFSLGLISLINCKAQKDATTQNSENTKSEISLKNSGDIIYLNEGENKFIKEFQTNITFKNIAEDSRCPQGTQCIWAGVAVANVEFMSTTSRPMILQLSTAEVNGKNYHKTQSFNGYNITLKEVTPHPTSQEGAKSLSGKYKIGISISKEGDQQSSTTK
ncbi:hypothetical protein IX39_06100 [Chryseobacterium formosense]|uniref:Uncharacterized protein n=1 Tax=Chryseobacterium formosense TaxID=236814 RepID=A0A085Z714_9FLAO|nr:hypothetical protein [Chryseobacterium formosense]KFF00228.1 hypothetical protein IX39_06100 [Chryseobacterium formosense]SFT63391.1 hypothetical protein SAMN05421857_2306 [Chryseobacterium formosense]